jgi:two-component system chemotaxis response regulator CheB
MIKILIADDSALMRKYLGGIFKAEGDFDVCLARNGAEALELARSFKPDVITLDVNMPEMDGITCLSRIMVECPKPVVMVSSITTKGAEVTFQALALGAVDFIAKPDGTVSLHIDKIAAALVAKVRGAAKARIRHSQGLLERVQHTQTVAQESQTRNAAAPKGTIPGVVLIGVSTGGPGAIECIVPRLPAGLAWPIVIAQHMPESFTGVFAKRINGLSALDVVEVSRPTPLRAGVVYIARGDADIVISSRGGELHAVPMPAAPRFIWHPSVERLVDSALENVAPAQLLGVMLTGMGNDGATSMASLRTRGGRTIAEAEETAVVWGMPGELVKLGGATLVLPLQRIADQISRWTA